MAKRPFFVVKENGIARGEVEFEWFSGFAVVQKQRSIASMHEAIRRLGYHPLEISTKSTVELGRKLSAFNLMLDGHHLENIFQSSKVFSHGGPFPDLLDVPPKDARRDPRLRESGPLEKFQYQGADWPLDPKTVFYDYIYYNAVRGTLSDAELKELCGYDCFTDIEFNPARSVNTQARSIAIVLFIYRMYGDLPEINQADFVQFHRGFAARAE